jgi:hypothetical protein
MGPTAFGEEDEEEATDECGSTRIKEDHFAPAHRRKKYSARKKNRADCCQTVGAYPGF